MKKIFLTFLLIGSYNLFATEVDNARPYRSGYLLTQDKEYKQSSILLNVGKNVAISDALNKAINLSQKENSFLVEKSINSNQKSDLLILKNKTLITSNELKLMNVKNNKRTKKVVKFIQ